MNVYEIFINDLQGDKISRLCATINLLMHARALLVPYFIDHGRLTDKATFEKIQNLERMDQYIIVHTYIMYEYCAKPLHRGLMSGELFYDASVKITGLQTCFRPVIQFGENNINKSELW